MSESVCVFVVDDDPLIAMTIEHALDDAGFESRSAGSSAEIMALFKQQGEICRALITDVNLGEARTGWDVARDARERFPNLPIVYVTGDSAHEWTVQGVPNSILVGKPFVAAQLITAVATLLNAS